MTHAVTACAGVGAHVDLIAYVFWLYLQSDFCTMLVQVLSRSLIMWNSVAPSEAWINSNLPHVSSHIVCKFILPPQ